MGTASVSYRQRRAHRPRQARIVAAISARVLVVTVLFTLLSFALGLFIGIVGVAVANGFTDAHLSMAAAYRSVAAPMAMVCSVLALIGMIIFEYRAAHKDTIRLV